MRRRPRAGRPCRCPGRARRRSMRRRARLASLRVASGDRSTIGAIWSNGTVKTSCSTNASRSGRRQACPARRTAPAPPRRPASRGARGRIRLPHRRSGPAAVRPVPRGAVRGGRATCSGRCGPPRWSARRRGWRFPRHPAGSPPVSRSQASCTASSSVVDRAQHAVGEGAQMRPGRLKACRQVRVARSPSADVGQCAHPAVAETRRPDVQVRG